MHASLHIYPPLLKSQNRYQFLLSRAPSMEFRINANIARIPVYCREPLARITPLCFVVLQWAGQRKLNCGRGFNLKKVGMYFNDCSHRMKNLTDLNYVCFSLLVTTTIWTTILSYTTSWWPDHGNCPISLGLEFEDVYKFLSS